MRKFFIALTRNPISLLGVAITSATALIIVTLFAMELVGSHGSPYIGILAYMILPGIFVAGLALIPVGIVRERRRARRYRERGEKPPGFPILDLNVDRRLGAAEAGVVEADSEHLGVAEQTLLPRGVQRLRNAHDERAVHAPLAVQRVHHHTTGAAIAQGGFRGIGADSAGLQGLPHLRLEARCRLAGCLGRGEARRRPEARRVRGLVAGGFVTMLVDRIPDATPLTWRSRCPACDHPLSGRDSVPVVSCAGASAVSSKSATTQLT